MTADELILVWARERYEQPNATRVELRDEFEDRYSEMTPGMGAYTDVRIYKDNKLVMAESWTDHTELIREIARFAAERLSHTPNPPPKETL